MKKYLLLLLVSMLIATSCQKSNTEPISPSSKTIEDLNVSATFDWNSTKDYQFTISGPLSRTVSITSTEGAVYQKGLIQPNTPFIVTVTLPSYIKKVRLVYVDQNVEYTLTGTTISYTFN